MKPIEYIPVLIFSLTVFWSIIVLAHDPKNKTNQSFFLFNLCLITWLVTNSLINMLSNEKAILLLLRLTIVGPIFLPPALIYFSKFFPREIKKSKLINIISTLFLFLSLLDLALIFTPLNIKSFAIENGEMITQIGILYASCAIKILMSIFVSICIIKNKYSSLEKNERKYVIWIISAVTFTLLIGTTTNWFLAQIGIYGYAGIGPLSIIIITTVTAVAILRNKIFNTNIIATEVFVFIIIALSSLEILFSRNAFELISRSIIITLIEILCYFLIRSVIIENIVKKQVEKLSDELKEKNKELIKLNQIKEDFVHLAAHDINTPIASILGYLSLILDEKIGNIDSQAEGYLKKIYTSSKRLSNIVMNFLDTSKIIGGKLKLNITLFHINHLVSEVVLEYKDKAKEKNNKIKFESLNPTLELEIKADREKLKEVFINLIDNALKFTTDGVVKIKTGASENYVFIFIEDSGVGIPKEKIAHIFEKFYQARDDNSAKKEGSGIGLYIVQSIIEMHHGKIKAESMTKAGIKFTVILPKKYIDNP